jgi:DNA-binding MarR family transcriptional regulator
MKLEDEIKQKKFTNEFHKANVNLIFTSTWLNALHHKIFKKYGISNQQFNILRILRGQNGATVHLKLLTERMLDKMSNTSRLVEKLFQKKLVERNICKDNRRQIDIKLSATGLELVNEISEELEKKHKGKQNLSIDEAKELNRLLDKLRG